MDRRGFIQGAAWASLAATAGGCMFRRSVSGGCGSMSGFVTKPMERVRVGFVGIGARGIGAVHRCAMIPGVDIVAVCDNNPEKLIACRKWFQDKKLPLPKEIGGDFGWRDLCQMDIDVVYEAVPWELHVPVALEAMRCGKHALVEVPAAMTIDDCWELVETSEKTRLNCMMLENCCYGENEMLALNMTRKGVFGEIVYGEAGYLHHGSGLTRLGKEKTRSWQRKWYQEHHGNIYPTHGLGPVALCMDINRGDRFDYLTSVETGSFGPDSVTKKLYPDPSDWRHSCNYKLGDYNTTIIRTVNGKSILLQLSMFLPHKYSRINTIQGTRGIMLDYPLRIAVEKELGQGVGEFNNKYDPAETERLRDAYKHPMWKVAGEVAKKVGGHGGMDFIMDLRWVYCLQNGLPLDMDVYDLAAWSCIFEASERSVNKRSMPIDIPDFTRGAWKSAKPLEMCEVDLAKMGIGVGDVHRDESALGIERKEQ